MLNIERSFTNFLYFKMTDFWSKAVQKKKKKKIDKRVTVSYKSRNK